jgi:hypothetical protein
MTLLLSTRSSQIASALNIQRDPIVGIAPLGNMALSSSLGAVE